jgi:hypothetical protein
VRRAVCRNASAPRGVRSPWGDGKTEWIVGGWGFRMETLVAGIVRSWKSIVTMRMGQHSIETYKS